MDQTGIDFRPIDLVDGQHRVRACSWKRQARTTIPFVLRRNGPNRSCRIFTEISVQNWDLNDLHKLHLKYVLRLPHHEPKSDCGNQAYLDGDDEADTCRPGPLANRLAYKIGAKLTLEDLASSQSAQVFDNHTGSPASSKQWVAYARLDLAKIWPNVEKMMCSKSFNATLSMEANG